MPRNAERVALIGDPRNDTRMIVSQLQVVMIKLHNRLVELARERGVVIINDEFADAAFRYGHSQVRDSFELNSGAEALRLFPDLIGFRPVPAELVIDWSRLFDTYRSLAGRDLERGHAYGLPSGEAVARAMGEDPLTDDPLGLRAAGWMGETPLWL